MNLCSSLATRNTWRWVLHPSTNLSTICTRSECRRLNRAQAPLLPWLARRPGPCVSESSPRHPFRTVQMEECSGIQGEDQAVTMSQLLNSGEHRAAHLQGLVRIGQPPRFPGGIDPTIHPQVQAIVNGQGVVVPRVAQRHSMRQVAAGGRIPPVKTTSVPARGEPAGGARSRGGSGRG
jgi:hypothetical protein